MQVIKKLYGPVQHAVVAFFRHDIALKRSRDGLAVVLEDKAQPKSGPRASRQTALARQEKAELQLMLTELRALLDEQPESRQTLRHIGFVLEALEKKGLRSLHKLPLDVLQKALNQFEGLVTNWSPQGLANLRSKMAVAIIDREHVDPDAEADMYRTTALLDVAVGTSTLPEVVERTDDEALAAAYAAMGHLPAVGEVELQAELGSASARSVAPPRIKPAQSAGKIKLRTLQE